MNMKIAGSPSSEAMGVLKGKFHSLQQRILLLLLLGLLGIWACQRSRPAYVTLRVVDEQGQPVSRVGLKIGDRRFYTNQEGKVEFSTSLAEDSTIVTLQPLVKGYNYVGPEQIIFRPGINSYVLRLQPVPVKIFVQTWLKEAENHLKPLPHVKVFVNNKLVGESDFAGALQILVPSRSVKQVVLWGSTDAYEFAGAYPNTILKITPGTEHYFVDLNFVSRTNSTPISGPKSTTRFTLVEISTTPADAMIYLISSHRKYEGASPFRQRVVPDFYRIRVEPRQKERYEVYESSSAQDLLTQNQYRREITLIPRPDWPNIADTSHAEEKLNEVVARLNQISPPDSQEDNAHFDYVRAQFTMAQLYFNRMKNYVKAIEHFQKALKYDPGNSTILMNLAIAFYTTNQCQKALEALDAIEANAQNIPPENYDSVMVNLRLYKALSLECQYTQKRDRNIRLKAIRAFQEYIDKFPHAWKGTSIDKTQICLNKMKNLQELTRK